MKVEATGYKDTKRIVDDAGNVVAMVERYNSGRWAIHDKDTDKRITAANFTTPNAALKFWNTRA